MLSIQNVSAGYGGKIVLQDVSLHVQAGEFLGLLGPNGCGKTTLLRVITGVLPPRDGRVLLQGKDVRDIHRQTLARTVGCLSQDLSLDLSFTVRELALMGRAPHLSRLGWETRRDLEIVERAMAMADISDLADRPITQVSGGERQRAMIAMCLAQEPRVLLLDEPTNHLDIAHQLFLLDLIRTLNRQTGLTVVAVFHDLNLAAEYCDRLLVLDCGRAAATGQVEEVLSADMIRRTYGATVHVQRNPVSGRPHVVVAAGMNQFHRTQPSGQPGPRPCEAQGEAGQ